MNTLKIIVVAGARPNFMKVMPFLKEIGEHNSLLSATHPKIEDLLVHTGQHYDDNMSDIFFRELGIRKPDFNLGVGSASHAVQTAQILVSFEAVCKQNRPDWVIVVGDVNSTMGCTLVCAKMGIQVAHIEAGLRSFDRTMPEEINRLVTDALADLCLTPSEDANINLLREGVAADRIKLVGNIMIDSLVDNLPKAHSSGTLEHLGLEPGQFIYVTLHRPSNVDGRKNLSGLMKSMGVIARRLPVVFPVHPRTRKMMTEYQLLPRSNDPLYLLEPLGYHASLCLTENARAVLTDSGGLQEEATYFRTPCLTLRANTERPVTLTMGSNRLTRLETLLTDFEEVIEGPFRTGQVPPLWDGHTAKRVLEELLRLSQDRW
jgi:UDP-N-acetylglucosamine 2-epimerase (non-hydrolysing)